MKYWVGQGIKEADFTRLVNRYWESGVMETEEFEELDAKQQYAIQTLKRLLKRLSCQ